MSKTILITGGAASGKSRWAATYLSACDYVLYLCANDSIDPDTKRRIEFDNKQNGVEWDIVTGITDSPSENFFDHKFVIFDALSTYTMRTIDAMCEADEETDDDKKKAIEKKIIKDVTEMFERIEEIDGSMIIITVETGFSVTPENPRLALYRQILGAVNQRIANMSDEVYFSASGIQFKIK